MRVFAISPYSCYGGGLVIIAANNRSQAWQILNEKASERKIDINDFVIEDMHLIRHLSTDLTEPQIIIEDYYIE